MAASNINLTAQFTLPEGFGNAPPVTVQMAAPAAPNVQVDVHVPESPAPVINNRIKVDPTPITVEAKAGETQVIVQHPVKAVQTVERNPDTLEITQTITRYDNEETPK